MTPIVLLDNLAEFVKEQTANIILQVRTEPGADKKERAAEVHKMRLPKKEDSTRRIPYILLQILTGKDGKNDRGEQESTCQIRIVVGTYGSPSRPGAFPARKNSDARPATTAQIMEASAAGAVARFQNRPITRGKNTAVE